MIENFACHLQVHTSQSTLYGGHLHNSTAAIAVSAAREKLRTTVRKPGNFSRRCLHNSATTSESNGEIRYRADQK